jgi:hypothetical protein
LVFKCLIRFWLGFAVFFPVFPVLGNKKKGR